MSFVIALNTPRKNPTTLKPLPLIEALSSPPPQPSFPSSSSSNDARSHSRTQVQALFSSREHQDAQELFILLSERVKEEADCVEREGRGGVVGLRGLGLGLGLGASATSNKHSNTQFPPIPRPTNLKNPFEGLTANRRSCVQCGYTEAVMHFSFSCWSLSLPRVVSDFLPLPLSTIGCMYAHRSRHLLFFLLSSCILSYPIPSHPSHSI